MFLWVKKGATSEGDLMVTFDPPDDAEADEWSLYTTRDRHYAEIARELDKQAKIYDRQNDHRAATVAKDLAENLRKKTLDNTTVN